MTVGSSAVLIMLFVLKHKFTTTAAADLSKHASRSLA